MDALEITASLEEERSLLWEFLKLSERQLTLMESDDLEGLDRLLEKRARMTCELEAIEATLGVWISDIQQNPKITTDLLEMLKSTNEEIVRIAGRILEIDDRTRKRLESMDRSPRANASPEMDVPLYPGFHLDRPTDNMQDFA